METAVGTSGSPSTSPGITDINEVQDRTFGFTAATLIGGGFGVALFGALTFISELFASSTKATTTLVTPVGPLSGKTISRSSAGCSDGPCWPSSWAAATSQTGRPTGSPES